jgi:ribose transport system ATP-binding protein/inositol transport system ATP-binding protein
LNLIGSVRDNICIVSLQALTKHKLTNRRNEVKATDRFIQKLKIKTDSREKQTGKLSGGNQQKVVVSKWLLMEPDIIILDEPTRGIDVGAKRDIYMLMGDLVEQGKAIIMISSEMPEVMGMSDRIVVLAEGRVTGEIERKDFDQERIMQMQFAVSE